MSETQQNINYIPQTDEYKNMINSSLELSDKQIEPQSPNVGFKNNTRDLQMGNIGPDTEFFIHKLSTLISCLKDHYEDQDLFPKGFNKKFIEQRDRIMIISNSRNGFLRKLPFRTEQIQHRIIDDNVEPTKAIIYKRQNEYERNNSY